MAGLAAVLAAVTTALLVGVLHRRAQGRVRVTAEPSEPAPEPSGLPAAVWEALTATATVADPTTRPPSTVTLLQLSTTFCAPCRHTRALLADVAAKSASVRHVDLDVTHRPDLVGALRVHRAPTTIAFDPAGRELFRIGGVPRREALLTALRPHLPAPRSEDPAPPSADQLPDSED
ncbi:thiol-disulfide isomerase/thioredoxin [Actinoalloteichus hoggarensis]|uniref:Thioredoxin n=1 Tax=Actinoalloteichus hoggarensis TaxID=1470176 RepID=A0A221WBW3_9PSEU|nr:thioredoxin family protein [Actinoalloteichus hoggarensis]ASO22979.1 Thioredoxin [Actinoalloteichus hoggarensis]MBB5922582.1 thiol-disulfide isomerase/thioredoxin [Actinoalloteichus hoggarensis]